MLQVRKSHFCGISAIFFQCWFMNETQVLMTVSKFFWGGIISWKEALLLHEEHQLWWGGGVQKKLWDGMGCPNAAPLPPPSPPTIGNPECQELMWYPRIEIIFLNYIIKISFPKVVVFYLIHVTQIVCTLPSLLSAGGSWNSYQISKRQGWQNFNFRGVDHFRGLQFLHKK